MSTPEQTMAPPAPGQGAKPRPSLRSRLQHVPGTLVLAAALIVAAAGLHAVLSRGWWQTGVVLIVTVPLVTAALVRIVARWRWLPSAVAALVASALVVVLFAGDTLVVGLPRAATWERLVDLSAAGIRSIAEQVTPADADSGISLLVIVGVGAAAVIAELLLFVVRAPAATALPLLAVLAVPAAVDTGSSRLTAFIGTALLWLALLWVQGRRLRGGQALSAAAAVTAATIVLAPLVAEVRVAEATDTGGPSSVAIGVNPLIDLGADLRRDVTFTALEYRTTTLGGAYLRLLSLDRIQGLEWVPADPTDETTRDSVARIPRPDGIADELEIESVTTQIRIGSVLGRWLPVPHTPRLVTGLEGRWRWDTRSHAIRGVDAFIGGQEYTVVSDRLRPTAEQLRGAPAADPELFAEFLEVGENGVTVPDRLHAETERVTAGLSGHYEIAAALQRYFRQGAFLYSESTPLEQGYDGSGLDAVATFLERGSGYCVHFASAMAVMSRLSGIPARVAVGFLPGLGSYDEATDATTYSVRTSDLHAWPELYFEGAGWIPFEPTPGRGIAPDYDRGDPAASLDPFFLEGFDVPLDAPAAEAPVTPTERDPLTPAREPDETDAPIVWPFAAFAGLLLVLAAPWLRRTHLRFRRIVAGDPELVWRELRATAIDHGWSASDTETVRVLRDRLAALPGVPLPELDRVTAATEANAYGPDAGTVTVSTGDVRAVLRAIAGANGARRGWRSRLLPVTLRPGSRFRTVHERRERTRPAITARTLS